MHATGYCSHCDSRKLFVGDQVKLNHILHLLITVLLCGLWFPVWMIMTISVPPPVYRCPDCGTPMRIKQRSTLGDKIAMLLAITLGVMVLIAFVGVVGGKMIELGWIKNIQR